MSQFAAFALALAATFTQRSLVAATSDECHDAVPGDEPCYSNLLWARNTGIITKPEFYKNYTFLNANSPLSDFQYVLWSLTSPGNEGVGWNCTRPCMSDQMKIVPKDTVADITTTTTVAAASGLSSWPWWGWLLLLLALCCLLALCGGLYWLYAGKKEKGPSKKKRATKKPLPAQSPAREPGFAAQPVEPVPANFTVAPPVYMEPVTMATATPVPTFAPAAETRSFVMQPAPAQMMPAPAMAQPTMMQAPAPVMTTAQPIMMQTAPAPATAQPVVMQAAPAMITAQPMQQGGSLFDALDTNHDGRISRAEFQALVR